MEMEMDHTWESAYLPRLEARNSVSGHIAVCTLRTPPHRVSPHLDSPRINFLGPLATRTDLGWLLRGLYLNPCVRNLVLYGDDPARTADALLALWDEGLTEDGSMPGERGLLHPEMDRESVDRLRAYVKIWDMRDKDLEELAGEIVEIPLLPPEREARSFSAAPVPKRNPIPSRRTSFPMLATSVGDGWLQLLNLTLRCGANKEASGGERLAEVLNAILTIELESEEESVPNHFDFNEEDFESFYRNFIAPSPAKHARYSYGERLHAATAGTPSSPISQLEATVDRLKKSHDTQTGTMVLLAPGDLDLSNDAPSILSITFNILDGQLFGSFVLRSTDVYSDWPLDALALVRLQREVAARVGVAVGSATFITHAAHLYERDWERAMKTRDQFFERPLPLQVDPAGLFLFGSSDGVARAMLIDHDANDILWEGEFEDPEDLSWYIVDVMPRLHPQHIRYVGQECAALMRAIREGECYLQG